MEQGKITSNYQILNVLGRGGEGTVYLVREKATGDQSVLKVFHKPIQGTSGYGLRILADQGTPDEISLPRITIMEEVDKILAVRYPFVHLQQIHWRILASWDLIAQAMFATYCRIQGYLMAQHKIGLLDTTAEHFMIAQDGRFHFVDFGFAIKSIDHPRALDEGKFGYGFAMLLSSIYHKNLKLEVLPTSGYSYDSPCRYCTSKGLDEIASRHKWVKEILAELRSQNASIFLDAEFYHQFYERFPSRVPLPPLVVGLNRLLGYLARGQRLHKPEHTIPNP